MQQGADQLRRVLNAGLGVAIVVGGSIGLGILSMPGLIAGKLGDPLLILGAWVAGGLFTFLGANIYAELGTAYPRAGGPYVYVREAGGAFAGFVTGWSDSAVNIIASAAQASAIGIYLENAVLDHRVIAIAVLAILMMVNWYGLKVGARTQQALSLFKVGALVLLAIACIAVGGFKAPSNARLTEATFSIGAWIGAVMLVSETYAGWNSSVYFSEEDKDSDRNVPRALFWGIGAMMFAYLLVNAGFLAIIPMSDFTSSTLPVADAAQRIFGSESASIVKMLAVVSLIGIVNVGVMFAPRITFAMSRDGVLPAGFETLNRYGTPSWGLIAFTLPAMALVMVRSFDFLFTVTAFLGVAINGAVYVAFFLLRWKTPQIRRPYVARWYPWAPGLVVLISAGLLVASLLTDPEPAIWAIVAIALSWPIYQWMTFARRPLKQGLLTDLPD
jgi:APA family basic amino acid/polyamine antiporter